MQLRGEHSTSDPRLDRLPAFDERSRRYPITTVVMTTRLRSRAWRVDPRLDQGREGACVGFGWSHALAGSPRVTRYSMRTVLDAPFAREQVYWEAQKIDEWEGGSYPGALPRYEGTSVLAGAQVLASRGLIQEYRWAFGIDDVLVAVAHAGPVVLGVPWLASMFTPRPSGLLEVSGDEAGGHCIIVRGLKLSGTLKGERGGAPLVRVRNSWGEGWGQRGDCLMRVDDLEVLLKMGGEACVPVKPNPSLTV